ncbi:MAG: DUF559 domain-containing protein [Abitibacteriaceae bacterium]|nr:DUF559 domain-containing protein [Abditibacteriaceae bacterium]
MNNKRDLAIAREQHWYRIPVRTAPRGIEAQHLAFYQTKAFGEEKWAIRYWAEVKARRIVTRAELLPEEPNHPRANKEYYKLELGELQTLSQPIISRRGRRILFIPTTLTKFQRAQEINDLFNESPLEDDLWEAFKQERIEAERQLCLAMNRVRYCLDFALFCNRGQIDIECNGESWHASPKQIAADDKRDDLLATNGWSVLRFSNRALRDALPACLNLVRQTITQSGGLQPLTGALPTFIHER